MTEEKLETLLRLAYDSRQLDTHAVYFAPADCLPFARLEFVASGAAIHAGEQAHLRTCRVCRLRLELLSVIAPQPASRIAPRGPRRGRRTWHAGVVAAGLAACLALVMMSPEPTKRLGGSERTGSRAAAVGHLQWGTCILGDSDCDGALSSGDVAAFYLAVTDPEWYRAMYPRCDLVCVNDANCDGEVDDHDVEPFLAHVGS